MENRAKAQGRREAPQRFLFDRSFDAKAKPTKKPKPEADVHTAAAQEKLTKRLQAKVEIRRRGERGTLRIHFHSEEELMRLYDLLMSRHQGAD